MELAHTGRSFSRPQSSLNIQIFLFLVFFSLITFRSLASFTVCATVRTSHPFQSSFLYSRCPTPGTPTISIKGAGGCLCTSELWPLLWRRWIGSLGPRSSGGGAKPNQIEAGGQQHGPGQSSSLSHRPRQRHPHTSMHPIHMTCSQSLLHLFTEEESSVQSQNAPPFEISPPLLLHHWHRNTLE